jgi:hypothetical protein
MLQTQLAASASAAVQHALQAAGALASLAQQVTWRTPTGSTNPLSALFSR